MRALTSIAIVTLLGLRLIAGTIPVGKPEEVGLPQSD
jgi:hypothetical protein